jgi:uncharacterized protein YdaU (DUF1376 family)
MAEFPAFPLWTDAYLADTHHLSTTEHGAYLLLLVAMWRSNGTLPNDDRQLAKFARLGSNQWQRIKPVLMPFFRISGSTLTQGRLADELQYVRDHSKKQAKNARSRWENRTAPPDAVQQHPPALSDGAGANPLEDNNGGDAMGMPDACQSDAPTPTPSSSKNYTAGAVLSEPAVSDLSPSTSRKGKYPTEFEDAWRAYPTDANMSKLKAFGAWKKLDADDRSKVLAAIPAFIAHCRKNPDYRPVHMVRFITERRFDGFAPTAPREVSEADWRKRLIYARARSIWATSEWGPMPGAPGCLVPAEHLLDGDGVGWIDKDPRPIGEPPRSGQSASGLAK